MLHGMQGGRKFRQLALPVAEHGSRTHEQYRSSVFLLARATIQKKREQLNSFPQSHVIGETGAESDASHVRKPRESTFLVGSQLSDEIRGNLYRFICRFT